MSIPACEVRVGDALSGRGPQVRSLRTVLFMGVHGAQATSITVANGAYTDTLVFGNETTVEVIREHS